MEIRKDCKVEETNVKYTKDLVTKTKYLEKKLQYEIPLIKVRKSQLRPKEK
jgi:hypothetical protein